MQPAAEAELRIENPAKSLPSNIVEGHLPVHATAHNV
jgi:hypothetical protein